MADASPLHGWSESWGAGAPEALGPNADGLWRPAPWREAMALPGALPTLSARTQIGTEVTLCHDGGHRAGHEGGHGGGRAAGRIERPDSAPGLVAGGPPFALALALDAPAARFASIVLEVPPAITAGLTGGHVVWLAARLDAPPPGPLHARLNLRIGQRLVQKTRAIERGASGDGGPGGVSGTSGIDVKAGFDLGAEGLAGAPPEQVWIDLIFGAPLPGRVVIGDLMLRFRPRALV